MAQRVLVTGAAGFIGFHLSRKLARQPDIRVVGVDNFDDYYDPQLKRDRVARLEPMPDFEFDRLDLADHAAVAELFERSSFDRVVHLAAQPGVRASSKRPRSAVSSNVNGFLSVLEACRDHEVEHLVFASSSSVYGRKEAGPSSEDERVDEPVSLYAATKVSNEAMAHSYAHLYDIPTTGLRFFTVYGPWGRPDMAYYLFADAIARGETIDVFNNGEMQRDFTYVGDVAEGISRVLGRSPAAEPTPYRILNVGRSEPVELMRFIRTIEREMGREADKNFCEMPGGDVKSTHADVSRLSEVVDFTPSVGIDEGLGRFVAWFRDYHGLSGVEEAGLAAAQ